MIDDIQQQIAEFDEQLPPRTALAKFSGTIGFLGAVLSVLTHSIGSFVFFTAGVGVAVLQYWYAKRVLDDE